MLSHFNIVRRALITTGLMDQMSPRSSWTRCCYFSLQVSVSVLFRYSNILWYCYINDFTYFTFFFLLQSHCLVLLLRLYSYTVCESPTAPYPYPILWHWLVGVHATFLLYPLCIIRTVPSSHILFAQLHYTCSPGDLHSHHSHYTFCLMGTLSSYQY